MIENDAGAATVRDYFKSLLSTIWTEEEGFSGKRPFGNSGWQREVIYSLVKFGVLEGQWDDDEKAADQYDDNMANELVIEAIEAL